MTLEKAAPFSLRPVFGQGVVTLDAGLREKGAFRKSSIMQNYLLPSPLAPKDGVRKRRLNRFDVFWGFGSVLGMWCGTGKYPGGTARVKAGGTKAILGGSRNSRPARLLALDEKMPSRTTCQAQPGPSLSVAWSGAGGIPG